jgi:deoxyribodipyrimidine photo-lyase
MRTAIVWFRNDLRLADNPALSAALAAAERVLPVYVHAPEEAAPWAPGAASRWWLHHSLAALDAALRERGAALIVVRGPTRQVLPALAARAGAGAVYWNRVYEPTLAARDRAVSDALCADGRAVESFPGNLLVEPWTVSTQAQEPFRVFTPFWRACQTRLASAPPPLAAPRAIRSGTPLPASVPIAALGLLPRSRWDAGLAARFTPGENGAARRLAAFVEEAIADYAELRDRPGRPGTSRLSPHLHFGELSPRQALAAARSRALAPGPAGRARGTESFVRELLWREFAHHVFHHFPHTATEPLDPRFATHAWRTDPAALAAWQQGRTGIPLVDAGMRELWHSGWMHNRVRMIVASLLTKNLGLPWLEGARWFHDTLVDADLASNTLGWQWTAGCGADAAPYYRIFNPVLQSERFDTDRAYLRTWLPELAALPDEWIHRPAAAPAAVRAAAGVELGRTYPAPIVDLTASRERALGAWQRDRGVRSATRPTATAAPRGRRGSDDAAR